VITLVLGGARSGKSATAERVAAARPEPVTYVATAALDDGDEDMAARVAAHRVRRPASWSTVELGGGDLPGCLLATAGTVLLDSLGTWVAARLDDELAPQAEKLADALASRDGDTVVVSEEVGMSVHPPTELGRRFVDALGDVNQLVAAAADEVLLVVAGRTLRLEGA
jgi:nicotinate-nucleotide--dimethylbenzimidazole phosphoribosyltransferase